MKPGVDTRKTLAVFLMLGLGLNLAAGQPAAHLAPDFVLKSLAGDNLRLSEFRGEVVLLSFGASWCGECRRDLATLAEFHALYADAGLRLLAVSVDASRRQAAELAAATASFPLLLDADGEVAKSYAVETLPTTILIDRDGRLREVVSGGGRAETPLYLEPLRALLRE